MASPYRLFRFRARLRLGHSQCRVFLLRRFQTDAGKFMAFLTLVLTFAVIVLKWLYMALAAPPQEAVQHAEATGLGAGVRQWEVAHTRSISS